MGGGKSGRRKERKHYVLAQGIRLLEGWCDLNIHMRLVKRKIEKRQLAPGYGAYFL